MKKTDKIRAADEIVQFLKAYAEYHINDTPIENEPTDAQMLMRNIPILEDMLKQPKPKRKPKSAITNYGKLYESDHIFKNYVDTAVRHARESVNPNYKFCVCNDSFGKMWLTDDIDKAMQFASTQSKLNTRTGYNVMKIVQAKDGTYKTVKECWYSNGKYQDGEGGYFLHFDYLAQYAFEINKLE